jgi:hypothetical protein
MERKIGTMKIIGISLVAALILTSCSARTGSVAPVTQADTPVPLKQGESGTPVATKTPSAAAMEVPSATGTVAPAAAPTIAPTAVPTEPATSTTQAAAQVIPTLNAYCRKGPGAGYHAITFLAMETAYNVIGRDSLNNWWQIQAPGHVTCWVTDAYVTRQGPVEQVMVAQAPPLPGTPALFVSSFVCDTTNKTLGVSLNWAAVANVTGFRIYRNGTQVADVDATMTSFHDDAPLGVTLVYELEAYNDNGVAARISTNVQSCG